MPFITEKLWNVIVNNKKFLMNQRFIKHSSIDQYNISQTNIKNLILIISSIRNLRSELNISYKNDIDINIVNTNNQFIFFLKNSRNELKRLLKLGNLTFDQNMKKVKEAAYLVVLDTTICISLNDLVDEVSSDVTRFFFIMRSMNTHLNFDINLAKEQSDVNPVFYIQYAHARCCNIIRRFEKNLDSLNLEVLSELTTELESQIIGKLLKFPELIQKSAETLEPQNISNYLSELSSTFHSYYAKERVIGLDIIKLTEARIYLVNAIRIVLRNGLNVLGISAPEKM